MKKFLKSSVVLALTFVTMTSMANNPKISLKSADDSKSLVLEMDAQSNALNIKLIDENAQTIYSENILDVNYAKMFNLKNLAVGTYYFTVENTVSSVVYTLNVNSSGVTIANKEENSPKPIFRKTGDKVFVNLFNGDQQKVDIEIVDSRNRIVYKESIKGELIIGKAFNFENAVKGNYTIRVADGEETYYQNISIG
ncbi:hypothetical protein [Pricia sp.]|uniref:hypothetical protein n=1 Tax=Pricia sp. TaxID=2268138 RepID=UPI003593BF7F